MRRIEPKNETNKNEVSELKKRTCSYALKAAIVVAVVFLILQENAIAKGLLLGTLCSIVNFMLLGISVPMAVGQTRNRAALIGLFSILIRYILLAIPLILGIKLASISFIAVIVGIFAVQIVALIDLVVIRPIFIEKQYSEIKKIN